MLYDFYVFDFPTQQKKNRLKCTSTVTQGWLRISVEVRDAKNAFILFFFFFVWILNIIKVHLVTCEKFYQTSWGFACGCDFLVIFLIKKTSKTLVINEAKVRFPSRCHYLPLRKQFTSLFVDSINVDYVLQIIRSW